VIGELVAIVVLLLGIAILGVLTWRLTLHLIGVDPQELALWTKRFRERRAPEPAPEPTVALTPVPATPTGVAERVDRVLAQLDDRPGTQPSR